MVAHQHLAVAQRRASALLDQLEVVGAGLALRAVVEQDLLVLGAMVTPSVGAISRLDAFSALARAGGRRFTYLKVPVAWAQRVALASKIVPSLKAIVAVRCISAAAWRDELAARRAA